MTHDIDPEDLLLGSFRHWSVHLHPNQSYIGRLVIWARADGDRDFAGMTEGEREELFNTIFPTIKAMFHATFQPERLNYS